MQRDEKSEGLSNRCYQNVSYQNVLLFGVQKWVNYNSKCKNQMDRLKQPICFSMCIPKALTLNIAFLNSQNDLPIFTIFQRSQSNGLDPLPAYQSEELRVNPGTSCGPHLLKRVVIG